ncbi:hypothetical protein QTP88_017184 [Uroleucon formosanum]
MIRKLKTKVKQLQQKVQRQNKSIQNMKDLLKILKDKKLLANESEELLLEKLDSTTLELFQNVSKNKGRKSTGYRYSKEIKEFALTLHYYSPKAYEYARSIFILPNSKSIMNWTSSVNGEPSIFSEVMQALQNLNPQDKHCNLCFDAMSIRKQVIWSEKDNKYIGYCDFGNELQLEGINTEATEALFFMLISLNGRWKLPIAQAEIIKSILKLSHQSGLKVWGITCDGAYTNIFTMKILGCKLGDNYSEIKCWFPHLTTEEKVYFIPDACHNLKLARNILGNSKVLKSDLVSSFENIDATEEYCRAIDQLFDFLNSKNIYAKNFKSPITKQNIVFLENKIIPLIKYLYSLKYDDQLLHTTGKKTFIHGFAIAVKSLFSIARSIFADESLNFDYLLTYKFSQDHLELLFCQIRQRGGSNNNPNIMQLKTAVKQILIKNALKLKNNGNCNTFDDDAMCNIFDFKWNKNSQNDQFNDESDENDPEILQRLQLINNLNPSLQAAKENILYYILGYLITKVVKQLDCNSCKDHDLITSVITTDTIWSSNVSSSTVMINDDSTLPPKPDYEQMYNELLKKMKYYKMNQDELHYPLPGNIDDSDNAIDTNSDSESIVNCNNNIEMVQDAIEYLAGWIAKTFLLKFPEFGSTTEEYSNKSSGRHDYVLLP